MKKTPKNWIVTTLGEVFNWGSGGTPSRSKSSYFGGDIPWIKTGELRETVIYETEEYLTQEGLENSSAKIFPKGSIAIAMYGATVGRVGILGIDATTNQACGVATAYGDTIENKYLYYFLVSQKDNFINSAQGGAQPNISQAIVKKHAFPLPPLAEQRRIVAKLDAAMERLRAVEAVLEEVPGMLEDFRRSVLHWAVTGKLTEAKTSSWQKKKLNDVCTKIQDGSHFSPQKRFYEPGKDRYMYLTSKNIRNNYLDLSKVEFVDETFHQSIYQRCNPEFGDVLLTKDGANTGNVTLNTLKEPFSLLSSVCLLKTDKKRLDSSFLKYFIQSPNGQENLLGKMTGSAITRIILQKIKALEIRLPPLAEQKVIVDKIENQFQLITDITHP